MINKLYLNKPGNCGQPMWRYFSLPLHDKYKMELSSEIPGSPFSLFFSFPLFNFSFGLFLELISLFGFYFMFILLLAFCAYRVPSHVLIVGNYNGYFTAVLWSFRTPLMTWCRCWCTGPDWFAHFLSYAVLRLWAGVSFALLFSMYPLMCYPSKTTCMVSGLLYGFVYHQ